MQNYIPVLIVARPGRMRDSLRALLRAIPQLEIVGQADNGSSALGMVTNYHPSLVLLDSDLPDDEAWTVLKKTKSEWPQTRCIVLANSVHQQWLAKTAGADSVLLTGFPATKFFAAIEALLPQYEA